MPKVRNHNKTPQMTALNKPKAKEMMVPTKPEPVKKMKVDVLDKIRKRTPKTQTGQKQTAL